MGTTHQLRVARELLRALTAAGNANLVECGNDFLGTRAASAAGCGEPGLQRCISGIDAKADYMYRLALPRHRNLNAVDEIQPAALRRSTRGRQPTGVVVVGQSKDCYPALGGARDEIAGSQCAVGIRRVAMQI